jgi:disulfide bond formation protein DsbB
MSVAMSFASYVTPLFSWLTLLADVVLVLFVLALIVRNHSTDRIVSWIGARAVALSFIISAGGVVGSLLYSELVGYAPCVLCWIMRVLLYPQALLFGLALWWKEKMVLPYACALSIIGGIVALYHSYTQLGGTSLTPCTSTGGACSKVFVLEFGYISIPMMAFTIFALLIVVYLAYRRTSKTVLG